MKRSFLNGNELFEGLCENYKNAKKRCGRACDEMRKKCKEMSTLEEMEEFKKLEKIYEREMENQSSAAIVIADYVTQEVERKYI